MRFWKGLFSRKSAEDPVGEDRARVAANLGLGSANSLKVAKVLSEASSVAKGRAALCQAASVLEEAQHVTPSGNLTRTGASDELAQSLRQSAQSLDDDQVVPLCHRAAGALVQQAKALAEAIGSVRKDE